MPKARLGACLHASSGGQQRPVLGGGVGPRDRGAQAQQQAAGGQAGGQASWAQGQGALAAGQLVTTEV